MTTKDLPALLQDIGIDLLASLRRRNRDAGRLMIQAASRIQQLEIEVMVLKGSQRPQLPPPMAVPHLSDASAADYGPNVIRLPYTFPDAGGTHE